MKCLSVRQPWAHWIVHGIKRVENRTWRTEYRGRIAIHAARSRHGLVEFAEKDLPPMEDLAFGAIVGTVEIVDCVPVEGLFRPDDPHAAGPWCWVLERPRVLAEPVACPGQQKLFELPNAVVTAMEGQLA